MADRSRFLAFQPVSIGPLTLKNRLARAATGEAQNHDNGEVSEYTEALYRRLSRGGVGLIITGHAAVHPSGVFNEFMTRIHDDSQIASVRRIARAVHTEAPDCKVLLQLNHPGRQVRPGSGVKPVAPSAVPHPEIPSIRSAFGDAMEPPRALSLEEIEEIIACFAQAIRRAREAEFDGVELHAAHGWLLSSFLSPHTNRRKDAYGGSTENRTRILQEIVMMARRLVGDGFPILVKFNTDDCVYGGIDSDEAVRIAVHLEDAGFDAVETSGGMWEALARSEEALGWKPVPLPEARVGIDTREKEAYFLDSARLIKSRLQIPVILVGGIKSIDRIEEILQKGWADICAMCRPLIREPELPNRWLSGEAPDTAMCRSCNLCVLQGRPAAGQSRCRAEQTTTDPRKEGIR